VIVLESSYKLASIGDSFFSAAVFCDSTINALEYSVR